MTLPALSEPCEMCDGEPCIHCWQAEAEQLRAAIEEYRLWRPGEKGHAAAHRKLMEAIDDA